MAVFCFAGGGGYRPFLHLNFLFSLDNPPLLCYTVSEQTRGAVWLRRKCRTLQPDPDNAGVGRMFVGYLITIR